MPLQLLPAEDADFSRAIEIERLAFGTSPFNAILFPGPFPPNAAERRLGELVAQRKADPSTRWLKIVDTELESEPAVAFAHWHVYAPRPPPEGPRAFGPGCNADACEALFGPMTARRDKLIGDRHHVYLRTLITDPTHQRRGAGEMLTRWGMEEARRLQLPVFVESSEAAHRLYQKCGFRDIDT